MTGWSIVTPWHGRNRWQGGTPETIGRFMYRRAWQEPGVHRVLGRNYGQEGMAKGWSLLQDLAVHPATAQHIAFKLVRHFITDTPTPAMVRPIAQAFLQSNGDLKRTYRALMSLPQAWQMPLTKLRTPYELFVAQRRAMGEIWTEPEIDTFMSALGFLSNRPWEWDSPDGFPDDSSFWLTPDATLNRIKATQALLRRILDRRPNSPDALYIAPRAFGRTLSRTTMQGIRSTRNKFQGLACLLLSSEFQRR
jgi:uncharacterized protein (DUF1800 family)